MQNLILASNNKGKIKEINDILAGKYNFMSLAEAGIVEDIPEPFDTFNENALAKAKYVFDKTGLISISEDSGLIVPALNGAPGVFSARYAGEPKSDLANTQKLLLEMQAKDNRQAYYTTIICVYGLAEVHYFEGECHGQIALEQKGDGGFGYDPVFIPDTYTETFAQLPSSVKTAISHRSKAVKQLVEFLDNHLLQLK